VRSPLLSPHPHPRFAPVFDSLFAALFKYAPGLFARGELAFAAPGGVRLAAILAGVGAAAAALTYASVRARSSDRDRWLLGGVRMAAVLLTLLALLRPVLLLPTTVPQRSFVAVLVDDSRSMLLDEGEGAPRGWAGIEPFRAGSPLRADLESRFGLRFFSFSSRTRRVDDPDSLTFEGSRTDLAGALDRVREELSGLPLAGIVVVTDGGDNVRRELSPTLLSLRAAGVPVFPVGVGSERPLPDVQLSRVELPRRTLQGGAVEADLVVVQSGFAGRSVEVVVEDRGQILATRTVELPRDGEPVPVRLTFTPQDPGARALRFRIPAFEGEAIGENNTLEALLEVDDRKEKILYFEGEPRHEVGFLRRAARGDPNLQVVLLQRSAGDRFLRLDVDDPDELAGGFPRTREELFRYSALVLGSVEASFFSADQLRMMADFVSVRGGGLLALGGQRALGEGGYAGTPVADALPVVLESGASAGENWRQLRVSPTRAGALNPVIRLAEADEASAVRWASLPPLGSFNPVRQAKPGATVLLTGAGVEVPGEQVVLAQQRYGRGRSMVLAVHDLWTWRMHAEIPAEDRTHQTLVRQLLRWVSEGSPTPVSVRTPPEGVEPGESARVMATVLDSAFVELNGAFVEARITSPAGIESELPLNWAITRDGEYEGSFTPEEEGIHEIEVIAWRGEEEVGRASSHLRVAPSQAEAQDPALRTALLRRIAEETGGRLHTPATLAALPDDITHGGGGISVTQTLPLWDMPVLLLVLLGLLAGEWALRRSRGLA